MIFTCPECGARLRGDKPGAVFACHACANPVVVPAPAPKREDREPPEAPVPGRVKHRSPWETAAIVLGIAAVAHVAFFLLLTIDARSERSDIEELYTERELAEAKQPEGAPAPGTPAFRQWRRAHDLWLSARDYHQHGRHVTLVLIAAVFSFVVLASVAGWILAKFASRRRVSVSS